MSTFNETLFRTQFPEFSDTTKYPSELLDAYFDMAQVFISVTDSPFNMLNGKSLALALNYMTAHLLTLGLQASAAANVIGNQGGYETSSTIGDISVTKLAPPTKDAWGFWLVQTPYGQALQALLSVIGVGGTMVGGLPERTGFRKVGGVFW